MTIKNYKTKIFFSLAFILAFLSFHTASASNTTIRAFRSASNQTILATTGTKVQLNSESFDTNNDFDSTTNYRFTASVAGYYQVNGSINYTTAEDQKIYEITINKNGSPIAKSQFIGSGTVSVVPNVADVVYLGVGDYLELYTYHNSSSSKDIASSTTRTFFSAVLVPNVSSTTAPMLSATIEFGIEYFIILVSFFSVLLFILSLMKRIL